MSITRILTRHELTGMVRTWRAPVLIGVTLFLAVSGPFITFFLPDIVSSIGGLEIATAVPTAGDAQAQWAKDLSQIIALLATFIFASSLTHPLASGSAGLVLARPVPRQSFLVAPLLANTITLIVSAAVGLIANGIFTTILFDGPAIFPLGISLRWLLLVGVLLSATLLGAALTGAFAGAAGFGVGLYFLMALGTTLPYGDYSPAGLFDLSGVNSWGWAALSGTVFGAVCIVITLRSFSSRTIAASPRST